LVVVFLFVYASMDMALFTISDLRLFVRRGDLLSDVSACIERFNLYRYWILDLASLDLFSIFSHGCRKEVCSRNICPGCYVLDNGDLYSRLPSTSAGFSIAFP
jgi:hypothetical protein